MSFDDDVPIPPSSDGAGPKSTSIQLGRTLVRIINKTEAPLEETEFKVMLELMGLGSKGNRIGVDIVAVLDISFSMEGDKLAKMKTATKFLIRKLCPIDRLSIVTFDKTARRECELRPMTQANKLATEEIVNGLRVHPYTNITAGLVIGLQVLNDRKLKCGRAAAIMLMSDGMANEGGDPTNVDVGDVLPVHTFGFGDDHDAKVLNAIAKKSKGGTFAVADVENTMSNNLSIAFSQCLAGLQTVVVTDLKLTIKDQRPNSKIVKVTAGSYPQSVDNENGAVTISFGDLYNKEIRRVIVDLVLLAVCVRTPGVDVLQITTTDRVEGKLMEGIPLIATVTRTGTPKGKQKEELCAEEKRHEIVKMIKEARECAENEKLDEAKDVIVDAQNNLNNPEFDESNPMIKMLQKELNEFLKLLQCAETFKKKGLPFGLSCETSHDRQRFAAKGNVEKLRMFATPRMDKCLEQAVEFDKNPCQNPPTADEDAKQELLDDPLSSVVGPLNYYLLVAIGALKAIQAIIDPRC